MTGLFSTVVLNGNKKRYRRTDTFKSVNSPCLNQADIVTFDQIVDVKHVGPELIPTDFALGTNN